jgi:hypothetical protein
MLPREAVSRYEQALAGYRSQLGPDHQLTRVTVARLARLTGHDDAQDRGSSGPAGDHAIAADAGSYQVRQGLTRSGVKSLFMSLVLLGLGIVFVRFDPHDLVFGLVVTALGGLWLAMTLFVAVRRKAVFRAGQAGITLRGPARCSSPGPMSRRSRSSRRTTEPTTVAPCGTSPSSAAKGHGSFGRPRTGG